MTGVGEMGRDGLDLGVLAGRYRLVRPLGRGGMAEVYLGHDEVLDRDVAVKILLAKLLPDARFLERFRREARAAAALSHPNIVAVHDTGDEGGAPFIVMECVRGRSLDTLLPGGVGRDQALEICAEVCAALAYAHAHGIVHLDIKPGNILIAADGGVKVTDFGIARAAGSDTATTTSVLGTASYLSPEQARSGPVDGRSDLYSLGIVLYELATGRVPFRGGTPLQVALQHVSAQPQPPSELTELDPAFEALVLKALAKDPDERHQSAHELRAELLALLRGPDVAADRAAGLAAPTGPVTGDLVEPDAGPASNELSGVSGAADFTMVRDRDPAVATVPSAAALQQAAGHPAVGARRRRPHRLSYLLVGLVALLALAVLAMLGSAGRVQVPALVGLSEDEARRRIESEGLTAMVAARVSNLEIAAGHIISSDPTEGTIAESGQLITFIVSTGPPPPPAVVPRTSQPPPAGAGGENDDGVGRKRDEDQAEQARDRADRAEDAAEDAVDEADDAVDEAEDRREDEGKNDNDRGGR